MAQAPTPAAPSPAPATKPTNRLLSIDALRGFDMFWIIGGDELARALAKWWGKPALADQFEHVEWEGFRFYDLIFPLFLFLVGVVIPFSLDKLRAQGVGIAYWRIARRTALLFGLGLLCNGILQFHWPELRIAGVLQRIAICYAFAALIAMNTNTRGQIIALAMLLLGYWALLATVAPPGGRAGDFTKVGNLAGWVDRNFLPGKIKQAYYGYGDNEGLLSTIPAFATAVLGLLAGRWLRSTRSAWTKAIGLALAGVVSLALGTAWSQSFPIVKNLWTSSFVLVAGGWSLLLLALFYAVIDVIGFKRWSFFFVVIGVNAITIYVVPRFVDFEATAKFFLGGVYGVIGRSGGTDLSTAAMAVGVLAVEWLFLLFLYRNRIFLRV
jgi:predicted acyltransferase